MQLLLITFRNNRKGYDALLQKILELQALPASSTNQEPATNEAPRFRREDYPKVGIWTSEDYNTYLKKKDVAKVDNGEKAWKPAHDFLQDEDGSHPGRSAERKLHETCREVFESIVSDYVRKGLPPPESFGTLDVFAKLFFHKMVGDAHPWVYYSSGTWKGSRIGTLVFPGWKRTCARQGRYFKYSLAMKQEDLVDLESMDMDVETKPITNRVKRARTQSQSKPARASKKTRTKQSQLQGTPVQEHSSASANGSHANAGAPLPPLPTPPPPSGHGDIAPLPPSPTPPPPSGHGEIAPLPPLPTPPPPSEHSDVVPRARVPLRRHETTLWNGEVVSKGVDSLQLISSPPDETDTDTDTDTDSIHLPLPPPPPSSPPPPVATLSELVAEGRTQDPTGAGEECSSAASQVNVEARPPSSTSSAMTPASPNAASPHLDTPEHPPSSLSVSTLDSNSNASACDLHTTVIPPIPVLGTSTGTRGVILSTPPGATARPTPSTSSEITLGPQNARASPDLDGAQVLLSFQNAAHGVRPRPAAGEVSNQFYFHS